MEPYTPGGARRVIWELGLEMARRDWDVHFFYASHLDTPPSVPHVYFHRLPAPEGYFSSTYTFLLKGPKLFKKILREVNPDLVYDNTNPSPFLPAYFQVPTKRLIVRVHHLARKDAFMLKSGVINPLATIFFEECFRLANRRHVIVDSNSTLERLAPLVKKPKSMHIIAPGIPEFPEDKKLKVGGAQGDGTIFCVCRMTRSKGIDHLLRAWKTVEEIRDDCRLFIAGKGPQENEFRELAHSLGLKRCQFLGFLTEAEKQVWLEKTSIYVFPTLIEGLPISLLEALRQGLPVVTTDTWGARDVVKDGENGILVPTCAPNELSAAILQLMNSPDQCAIMSKNNLKRSEQYYLDAVNEQEIQLLNEFYQNV